MDVREYAEELRELRYDWVDEIPAQIKHSESGQRVKARKAWLTCVQAWASFGLNRGMYNGRAARLYNEFSGVMEKENVRWIKDRRTKRSEIDLGNELLEAIIAEVSV